MLIFQSGFSHYRGTDKQQPLTLAKYIVLHFMIVYIHSVSVVLLSLSPFKLYKNLTEQESFNNALRSLMSDNLTEVKSKDSKKR